MVIARHLLLPASALALLTACGPPDCPRTDEASLSPDADEIARGEEATLTLRYDRDVLPDSLNDHFSVSLIEGGSDDGPVVGAWSGSGVGAITDIDVLGPRTFMVDVWLGAERAPGPYLMSVLYTPDPQLCPGPESDVGITVD